MIATSDWNLSSSFSRAEVATPSGTRYQAVFGKRPWCRVLSWAVACPVANEPFVSRLLWKRGSSPLLGKTVACRRKSEFVVEDGCNNPARYESRGCRAYEVVARPIFLCIYASTLSCSQHWPGGGTIAIVSTQPVSPHNGSVKPGKYIEQTTAVKETFLSGLRCIRPPGQKL